MLDARSSTESRAARRDGQEQLVGVHLAVVPCLPRILEDGGHTDMRERIPRFARLDRAGSRPS
jgi:hypothetical protein